MTNPRNRAQIIGNLGADPESRTTAAGVVVATLRIATNERVKRDDEWVDHTEWHRVTVFGKTAEACVKHLRKGSRVYAEGPLRTTKWEDRDGHERWSTEILGREVVFLSASGGGNRPPERPEGTDDDIPF